MKILSIVGARPEFVQAMPVCRALNPRHSEVLVHTGQHYDYHMSKIFFDELDIPVPDYNLEVGPGSHAKQTSEIMTRLEDVILQEKPDTVIIRGDTNSTLAAALVASKLNIPLAHIEAGERSFDRTMPEEINRLVADRLSNFHFCVSDASLRHLSTEGITNSVHKVGDVMLDALLYAQPIAQAKSKVMEQLKIRPKEYALATIHRAANTNNPERLENICSAMNLVSEAIILPLHPRTQHVLTTMHIKLEDHIRVVEPVGYLDMLTLEENARIIATDSGGVQREAYYLKTPCLTLRDETEWTGTVEAGWNKLVGANTDLILDSWFSFSPRAQHPPIYGTGDAAQQIASILNKLDLASH